MKYYTLKDIELLMKNGELIDMEKVSMEHLNPVAWKYANEMEKAETFARDTFLKVVNDTTLDTEKRLDLALKSLQVYDFSKQSKEGVKFNFQQVQNKFNQYNESIKAKREQELKDKKNKS